MTTPNGGAFTERTRIRLLAPGVDGRLRPSVTKVRHIPGLRFIVTRSRALWALFAAPRGKNPNTGRRYSGGVRHELGDGRLVTLDEAIGLALEAKARIKAYRNPHAEQMAAGRDAAAAQAMRPMTWAESLTAYERDLLARRKPSETTRRQEIAYARKAIKLLEADAVPVTDLGVVAVRRLIRTTDASTSEVRHLYGSLSRFCDWLVEEKAISSNPCAEIPRRQRPKPGPSRDHVPAIADLRRVWDAVESESARDLVRFLLLVPLRRDEAAGLTWNEVDLSHGWIKIAAGRMKNGLAHELPLSRLAIEILEARASKPTGLVFPSSAGTTFTAWSKLLARIRAAIGESEAEHDRRFSLHDVRRSFATHLAGRFDENLIDLMLAHRPASRTGSGAAYQKAMRFDERPAVMTAWAGLVTGAASSADILPFRHVAR